MTDKTKPISSSNPPESKGNRTERERKQIELEQKPIIEDIPTPKSKSQEKRLKIQRGEELE